MDNYFERQQQVEYYCYNQNLNNPSEKVHTTPTPLPVRTPPHPTTLHLTRHVAQSTHLPCAAPQEEGRHPVLSYLKGGAVDTKKGAPVLGVNAKKYRSRRQVR